MFILKYFSSSQKKDIAPANTQNTLAQLPAPLVCGAFDTSYVLKFNPNPASQDLNDQFVYLTNYPPYKFFFENVDHISWENSIEASPVSFQCLAFNKAGTVAAFKHTNKLSAIVDTEAVRIYDISKKKSHDLSVSAANYLSWSNVEPNFLAVQGDTSTNVYDIGNGLETKKLYEVASCADYSQPGDVNAKWSSSPHNFLAMLAAERTMTIWHGNTGTRQASWEEKKAPFSFRWSPSNANTALAITLACSKDIVVHTEKGELTHTINCGTKEEYYTICDWKKNILILKNLDKTIKVINMTAQKEIATLILSDDVVSAHLTPDAKNIITLAENGDLSAWDEDGNFIKKNVFGKIGVCMDINATGSKIGVISIDRKSPKLFFLNTSDITN